VSGARRVGCGSGRRTLLTGLAGLAGVQELIVGLDMVGALDAGIGPAKQRDRGVSGGQLLMGMATAQLAGQDCLAGLDRVRADAGSALLTTAPVPPSTTAASIAGRFTPDRVAGIETGLGRVYRRWLAVGPASVRAALVLRNPTIDLDASDVEVFGRTKRNVGWTYAGVRAARVHLAWLAQAELPLADLCSPATTTSAQRPVSCCSGRWRCCRARCAAGLGSGPTPATSTPRSPRPPTCWAATSRSPPSATAPRGGPARRSRKPTGRARGACPAGRSAYDYAPAGWPAGSYTIVRRVKIDVERLSADPRSRRRRTVAKDQLALALGGAADHVWATSFIVTNIPADSGDYVGLEAWFRNRTSIEERFREAKLGAGVNHLPSADPTVNTVWMWAGLLAGATSVMLQALTGPNPRTGGRTRIATLRHRFLPSPDG